MPSLVRAAAELKGVAAVWGIAGGGLLAAGAAAAASTGVTTLEAVGTLVLLGLTVSVAVGGLLLAKRTGPQILYWRIFERAPEPPPDAPVEEWRRTRGRVIGPSIGTVLMFIGLSPLVLGFFLLVIGVPRDELLDHLPGELAIAAGTWTLVAAAASRRVAWYFEKWERRYGRAVYCEPLKAGALRPVYYATPPRERI